MSNDDRRNELVALRDALLALHRETIAAAFAELERERGVGLPGGATARFHLLTRDPAFGWLQPFTALLASLDERLDDPAPLEARDAAAARARAAALLHVEHAVGARLVALVQSAPEVAMAYGPVRLLLR
jgi:hypothetical protein